MAACSAPCRLSQEPPNTQYTRRNEPRDESCCNCRSRDRGTFVQCRIIILEHCHKSEIDRGTQTDDGDNIAAHFAKDRFAAHSAERAVFLKGIDNPIREYPRNS